MSLSSKLRARQSSLEALFKPELRAGETLECWAAAVFVRSGRMLLVVSGGLLFGVLLRTAISIIRGSEGEFLDYLLSFLFGFLPLMAILEHFLVPSVHIVVGLTQDREVTVFYRPNWRFKNRVLEATSSLRSAVPPSTRVLRTLPKPRIAVTFRGYLMKLNLQTAGVFGEGASKLVTALSKQSSDAGTN